MNNLKLKDKIFRLTPQYDVICHDYNASEESKNKHVSNRDVSDITYPQHDVLNILRCFHYARCFGFKSPQHDVFYVQQKHDSFSVI